MVVAEPGSTGGKSGQTDEKHLPTGNTAKLRCFWLGKYHDPRHEKNDGSTDRCSEIGVDTADSDLTKDGGQTGENRRQYRIDQPAFLSGVGIGCVWFLLCDHQKCAKGDQDNGCTLFQTHSLMEEDQGEKNC